MKKFILVFSFICISTPALAAEALKISVNGLVCDFCARAIEKVFSKQEAVDSVSVDLTTKLITANMKDGQTLSDDEIKSLITDAGYNLVEIKRENTDE